MDCHMPRQDINLKVFHSAGKRFRPQMRSRFIKVYFAPIFNRDTPKIP
jgi:hypothetical protein